MTSGLSMGFGLLKQSDAIVVRTQITGLKGERFEDLCGLNLRFSIRTLGRLFLALRSLVVFFLHVLSPWLLSSRPERRSRLHPSLPEYRVGHLR